MGKRSDFEKNPRDWYRTPVEAVEPLIPFLPERFSYAEPNAGDGALIDAIRQLNREAECVYAGDIEPQREGIVKKNTLDITEDDVKNAQMFIANPPWSRDKKSDYILHKMIHHLCHIRPTWMLFDSDWLWTKQATPFMQDYLVCTVAVGRVKWIPDSKMTGKDNCQWSLFRKDARDCTHAPFIFGRGIGPASATMESIYQPYLNTDDQYNHKGNYDAQLYVYQ